MIHSMCEFHTYIKAVLDMEKAYNDIDLERLDDDLDINAEGLMEELSELLLKELAGDLDGLTEDIGGESSGSEGDDAGAVSYTHLTLPTICSV